MSDVQTRFALVGSAALGVLTGWLLGRSQRFSGTRRILNGNHSWMTEKDLCIASGLIAAGHGHLLSYWPAPGRDDEDKKNLLMMLLLAVEQASQEVEKLRLNLIPPPVPQKYPYFLEAHGDVRDDPYYWMRDDLRRNPLVRDHLKTENQYTQSVMADTAQTQNDLYMEMRQRMHEEERSAPLRLKRYYYYSKTLAGKRYEVHCRRRIGDTAAPHGVTDEMNLNMREEVMLDQNEEAKRSSFYKAAGLNVSPNEQLLVYFQDTVGNEFYTAKIKDIRSGRQLLRAGIKNTWCEGAWSADSNALFYLTVDALGRPCKVWRHYINESTADRDKEIYSETDPTFTLSINTTRDLVTICILSASKTTSECRVLRTESPEEEPTVVLARSNGVYYWVEHYCSSYFFCIQDVERLNSEITMAPEDSPDQQTVLVPCQTDCKIEDFVVSRHYLTVFCRKNGLQTAFVYVLPHNIESVMCLGNSVELKFETNVLSLRVGPQSDFESEILRVIYTSLVTPESVIDHHLGTFDRCIKKMEPLVLEGYDEAQYRNERTWAHAADGQRIPISVVYRTSAVLHDGTDPLLLEVYGAYEQSLNPSFSSERISLLDRGIVYAIAHVRGGGEMGRVWYEKGRLMNKKTTFTDTIACARYLIEKQYCSESKLCISGYSAGGLAAAAVMNMQPRLFCAAILEAPFVDVLTSLGDASLPLTTEEWEEWGNPQDEEHYRYIKSYSPVENVEEQAYPHMLITGAYYDSRVGYWEPAKFAAKVRDRSTSSSMVLFKCHMEAGHSFGSSRFQKYRDSALKYAFLLKALGKTWHKPQSSNI